MGAVARGVAYLVVALIAFLTSILTLFVPLGTFDENQVTTTGGVTLSGFIKLSEGCVTLTDCLPGGVDCYSREMCANFNAVDCTAQRSTHIAARAFAILTVVSMVPSIIMGALDALGKLPALFCLSQRGLLVVKAAVSMLLCAVLLGLVTDVVYSQRFCDRPKIAALAGFSIGAVIFLVASTLVLNVVGCAIAVFVPPDDQPPTPSSAPQSPLSPPQQQQQQERAGAAAAAADGGVKSRLWMVRSTSAAARRGMESADGMDQPPNEEEMRRRGTVAPPDTTTASRSGTGAPLSPLSGMPHRGGTFGTYDSIAHSDW